MRIVINLPPLDEGLHICAEALSLHAGYKAGKVVGVCSDIPNCATSTGACRVRAPGSLFEILLFRQPVLWVFGVDDTDVSQRARRHHFARLTHHRISGVVVSQDEKRARGLSRCDQFLGICQGGGQWLVAYDVNAALQKFARGGVVDMVWRDDGDSFDPGLQTRLTDRHLFVVVIDPRQAQRLPAGLRLLRRGRKCACHQLVFVVQPGRDTVHAADKGVVAAAYHAEADPTGEVFVASRNHQSIPSILRFAASSVPPSAKSSKAFSVTRMI